MDVVATPVEPFTSIFLLALVIFREARGETYDGKVAVAWVIRNRVEHPDWYGKDYHSVITKKAQFTSINPPDSLFNKGGEPNLRCYGCSTDPVWMDSWKAATLVYNGQVEDLTKGATYYYAKSMDANPPVWAAKFKPTAVVGNHRFFKP